MNNLYLCPHPGVPVQVSDDGSVIVGLTDREQWDLHYDTGGTGWQFFKDDNEASFTEEGDDAPFADKGDDASFADEKDDDDEDGALPPLPHNLQQTQPEGICPFRSPRGNIEI